jgi:TPR repeat protein
MKYCRLAVDQNLAPAQHLYGILLENHIDGQGNVINAVKYYEFAANQGLPPAELSLGTCHMFGRGIEENAIQAAKLWKSAADHGYARGANLFGLCLEFGKGIEIDYSRAAQHYQKAADKSHAEAQYHFGFCLEHGFGVDMCLCEAAKYYQLSADQGHIAGLRSYARFLHYGFGLDQDLEAAATYYEKSGIASGGMFDEDQFRYLRILHRVSLSDVQFSRFSIPKVAFFSECQFASPTRSDMMFDLIGARSSYTSTEVIGRGAPSAVILVRDSNPPFAIKRFHPHINQTVFMPEIETLVRLNQPCILRILKYSLPTKSSLAEIHLEWASHGSLARVLELAECGQRPSFWNPTGIAIILIGIVLGIRFVHSRGFIHQDLNPSNILVNSEGRALIGDFGSSRFESDDITPRSSQKDEYTAPKFGAMIIGRAKLISIRLV